MDLLTRAVLNNVEWCGLVSDRGVSDDATGVWLVTGSPSPLFPDAVTPRRGVSADQLASVLSDRRTCSVKDSFADVDLGPHGFRPLFTGRWIGCAAAPGGSTGWSHVADLVGLKSWCFASRHVPGLPVVGYEHGADLGAALGAGFAELGPVRV